MLRRTVTLCIRGRLPAIRGALLVPTSLVRRTVNSHDSPDPSAAALPRLSLWQSAAFASVPAGGASTAPQPINSPIAGPSVAPFLPLPMFPRHSAFANPLPPSPLDGEAGRPIAGGVTVVTRDSEKDDAFLGAGAKYERLYIRNDEYNDLWNAVREYPDINFVVTGNRGIGKSVSALNYLAMRSLKEKPDIPVLCFHVKGATLLAPADGKKVQRYDHDDNNLFARCDSSGELFRSLYSNQRMLQVVESVKSAAKVGQRPAGSPGAKPQLLLLHDCVERDLPYQPDYISELRDCFDVCCVLLVSPKKVNYHGFTKLDGATSRIFCLPVWSRDHLRVLAKGELPMMSAKEFDARYGIVGGIPRVFVSPEDDNTTVVNAQTAAMSSATFNVTLLLGIDLALADATTQLVQLIPCSTCHQISCGWPISDSVRQVLRAKFSQIDKVYAFVSLRLLQQQVSMNRTVLGGLFEDYFLTHLLPKAQGMLLRRLELPPAATPQYELVDFHAEVHKLVEVRNIKEFEHRLEGAECTGLYRPVVTTNFPFVDAVLITKKDGPKAAAQPAVSPTPLCVTLFQTTVTEHQAPKVGSFCSVLEVLRKCPAINVGADVKLVWVTEDTGKLNSWQAPDATAVPAIDVVTKTKQCAAIPQYVLKVPISVPVLRLRSANKEANPVLEVHPEWVGLEANWANNIGNAKPKVATFVQQHFRASTVYFDGSTWIYS